MSRSGRVLVGLGVPVLVLLVGCGGGASSSGLPTVGTTTAGGDATPTPTVTSSSPWTPEQQEVLDGFRRYDAVVLSISGGAPLDMERLREVATKAWAQEVGQNLQVSKSDGFVVKPPASGIRRDFTVVAVDGSKATITACEDSTGTQLIKKGKPQPSSSDFYKPRVVTASLVAESGIWKVAEANGSDAGC